MSDSPAPVAMQEPWRGPGEAQPALATNELLAEAGVGYGDLAAYYDERLLGGACLGLWFTGDPDALSSAELAVFLELVNEGLSGSLWDMKTIELHVVAYSSVTRATAEKQTWSDLLKVTATRRAGSVLPLAPGQLEVRLLAGFFARTAAVGWEDGRPVLFIGEDVVREQQTSYLIHLVANLAGLPPVWGDGEPCADDGIFDTPSHSGANYDCMPNHYSGCNSTRELDANLMDARYCELAGTLTTEQRFFLAPRLGVFGPAADCEAVDSTDAAAACFFDLSPNSASQAGDGCSIRVVLADEPQGGALSMSVSQSTRVLVADQPLAFAGDGAALVDICTMGLPPGAYSVTVRDGTERLCTRSFIVAP